MATYLPNLAVDSKTSSKPIASEELSSDAIGWALSHGMAFKTESGYARHVPFSLTAAAIKKSSFAEMKQAAFALAKLIARTADDVEFIQQAIAPVAKSDCFFNALFQIYTEIHLSEHKAKCLPLLILRSDFMEDEVEGTKLVEFNSIASGMGPFGERTHQLHRYLAQNYQFNNYQVNDLIENRAIEQLSNAIAKASLQIKQEFNDPGPARFLMVVQENEDNVFDQHLLEFQLKQKGIQTVRRTVQQLVEQLTSETGYRLVLDDVGTIDTVYWRTGYQYSDYKLPQLIGEKCCQTAMQLRIFIEQQRVAVNATVAQQLASSKRGQMLMANMSLNDLSQYGLSESEAVLVKNVLGKSLPVDDKTREKFNSSQSTEYQTNNWVLKNQGEGGGHCLFGNDIAKKLNQISSQEYSAWILMPKISVKTDNQVNFVIRNGSPEHINDLISEIGLFNVFIEDNPANEEQGYAGYLVRSKSAQSAEGGVHSGEGVLNSLYYTNE